MAKKILLVVASRGYQPVEYQNTRAELEQAGVPVAVTSDAPEVAVDKDGGHPLQVDLTLDQVLPEAFDGIFVIGGAGALEHLDHPKLHALLRKADQNDLLFGAICISPRILANAGVLQGRRVTCWNEDHKFQEIADAAGATYVKAGVVVDNNLVTAEGPKSATEFGQAIAKAWSQLD